MTLGLDDERRRALLATRQLPTAAERHGRTSVDVARSLGPLHSTDPSTAYLQIHARADVAVADVDRALYEDRELLRHSTLRRTVHLLSLELVAPAHRAFNHRMTRVLRRNLVRWLEDSPDLDAGVDAQAWLGALEDEVVAAVEALDRPSGGELAEQVAGLRVTIDPAPGKAYSRPGRITSKVLELLIGEGRIARDRPRGADFTSAAWTYAPVTDWLPEGIAELEPAAAVAALVAHHLGPFPGSSIDDLAWWTGLPKGQIARALADLDAVSVGRDDGVDGHVLADDELEVADLDTDPRAALLPGLDATPMGCPARDWFLGPHEPELFDRNGNVGPTVWCRGRVVGGWTQREDGEVVVGLLEDIGADAREHLDALAERTRRWLGEVRVRWRYPTPLQRRLEEA